MPALYTENSFAEGPTVGPHSAAIVNLLPNNYLCLWRPNSGSRWHGDSVGGEGERGAVHRRDRVAELKCHTKLVKVHLTEWFRRDTVRTLVPCARAVELVHTPGVRHGTYPLRATMCLRFRFAASGEEAGSGAEHAHAGAFHVKLSTCQEAHAIPTRSRVAKLNALPFNF